MKGTPQYQTQECQCGTVIRRRSWSQPGQGSSGCFSLPTGWLQAGDLTSQILHLQNAESLWGLAKLYVNHPAQCLAHVNPRVILVGVVAVAHAKEISLETGNRFVLLRKSLNLLFTSFCMKRIIFWNVEDVHSFTSCQNVSHVAICACRVCASLQG